MLADRPKPFIKLGIMNHKLIDPEFVSPPSANCLTRALDEWQQNQELLLWYNANNVIALEPEYNASDLGAKGVPPLEYFEFFFYGENFLIDIFHLSPYYQDILSQYMIREVKDLQ
jgi:hypothetical protein